jgi:hypothetical protein
MIREICGCGKVILLSGIAVKRCAQIFLIFLLAAILWLLMYSSASYAKTHPMEEYEKYQRFGWRIPEDLIVAKETYERTHPK